MSNYRHNINLRAIRRRTGFSLAELVISIAILLLMLSLAGQVFNLTVKSTGQATAITRVNQDFRVLEETLRDDLRHVQPGQSVMVIQGNPVNAYWTRNGKDADIDHDPSNGYPHIADPERDDPSHRDSLGNLVLIPPRADMLMFFTARPGASYLNSLVTSNLQQVIYGHAEIGSYTAAAGAPGPNPTCDTAYTFNPPPDVPPPAPSLRSVPTKLQGSVQYPSPELVTVIPAEQWHLSRRAVLLEAGDIPVSATPIGLNYAMNNVAIDDPQLLRGAADTLWNFNFKDEVLRLANVTSMTTGVNGFPLYLPLIFTHGNARHVPYDRSQLALAPPALCADRLGSYFLPNCASFKVEWALNPRSEFVAGRLDGINETLWFDQGDVGDLPNTTDPPSPLRSLKKKVEELKALYGVNDIRYRNAYSVLCCPRGANCQTYGYEPAPAADGTAFSLADRFDPKVATKFCGASPLPAGEDWTPLWPDPNRPNLAEFNATRPVWPVSAPPVYAPEPVFPGVLRITVDLYDPERRLEKPIRHVMVIPVGE